MSRAVAWGKSKRNLKKTPAIPFGTRVVAHLPLKKQSALSGRAFPAVVVGSYPYGKGVIKLLNTKTKRIILRRTFKVLGLVDRVLNIEVSDEEGIDELTYDIESDTMYGVPEL